MKKLLLIGIMLLSTISFTQESNNIGVVTSPGSWDDGFSIGAYFEHQNNTIYVGPEVYYFPNLHQLDFLSLGGRFGFNKMFDIDFYPRIYAGGRAGVIYRETGGWNYAYLGIEAGLDIMLTKNLFIRGSLVRDMRSDSKLWGEDAFYVNSVFASLGIKF